MNIENKISPTKKESSSQNNSNSPGNIIKPPTFSKSDLKNYLDSYWGNSDISNLETYYSKRDSEINNLMYSIYDCTKDIETIKLAMPIAKPAGISKFIKKRESGNDSLFGGSSTMSRRSNSSMSSGFGANKAGFMAKPKFGAQKVSINIDSSVNISGLNNSKIDTSMVRRETKSIDPKLSTLKKDLTKITKSNEVTTSVVVNKLKNESIKNNVVIGSAEKNKVISKGIVPPNTKNSAINLNSSNFPTVESIDSNKNKAPGSGSKPVVVKAQTPAKKPAVTNSKSITSSVTTTETERPKSFKFEPKKKQQSMLTGTVESILNFYYN